MRNRDAWFLPCLALIFGCGRTTAARARAADVAPGELIDAAHFASSDEISIRDIAAAADGRVAIGGFYQGKLSGELARLQLPDSDSEDGFVAVLPSASAARWSQAIPGFGAQGVTGVAFATDRDLVVQGYSDQRRDAGAGLRSDGALVARFDTSGDVNLRKGYAGDQTFAGKVATDSEGATLLVGSFVGQFDFYGLQQIVPPYVIKLDRDGAVVWVRDLGASWGNGPSPLGFGLENLSVAVDGQGAALVTGDVNGLGNFGFLAKLNAAGELLYLKQFAGDGVVHVSDVAIDDGDAVLVTGSATKAWSIDDVAVPDASASAVLNGWLAKLSDAGELQWLEAFPSASGNGALVSALALDAQRNIVIAGTASDITFGDATLAPDGAASETVFVAKLDPNGQTIWTYATDAQGATVYGVACDANDDVWIAGEVTQSLSFEGKVENASGSRDAFLLQLAR